VRIPHVTPQGFLAMRGRGGHYAGVQAVRWELARADRNEGRRGLLLRTLDALGIGFDS
jgi:hypothetical protein